MKKSSEIIVFGKEIFSPARVIKNGIIKIRDGVIESIQEGITPATFKKSTLKKNRKDAEFLEGDIIAPGYLDIHIQGCNGFDFIDTDSAGVKRILEGALKGGATQILPTITISKNDTDLKRFKATIKAISENLNYKDGAEIAGIHLEGPYLNIEKRGGFPPDFIKPPSLTEFKEIISIIKDFCGDNFLKLITIAPEINGAVEIIKYALDMGISVAIGHTTASYDLVVKMFSIGVNHITHIFNAMSGLNHREPGVLGAALENENIFCQVIPDGIHLHPAILRILLSLKGADRLAIISDGTAPCGLKEGSIIKAFNGSSIFTIKDGAVRNEDGTLAGSALLMNRAVASFKKFTNASLNQVFTMSSLTPAKSVALISAKQKHLIHPKLKANLIVLSKNLGIKFIIYRDKIFEESEL